MSSLVKLCAYCGTRPATENEHVVAKIFYVDQPRNGITVPSCTDCNRGRGDDGPRDLHLDEEYLRNALCVAEGTRHHPIAAALGEGKVIRSFARSLGLAASFWNASGLTEFRTEGGIFEPYSSPYFYVDFPRVQRVLRKITKGLFYWGTGRHFPPDYLVLANPMVRPDEIPALEDKLNAIGSTGFQDADEYGVFRFMLAAEKGKITRTQWLMQFYDWAIFHTRTLPRGEVSTGDTGMPIVSKLEIFR